MCQSMSESNRVVTYTTNQLRVYHHKKNRGPQLIPSNAPRGTHMMPKTMWIKWMPCAKKLSLWRDMTSLLTEMMITVAEAMKIRALMSSLSIVSGRGDRMKEGRESFLKYGSHELANLEKDRTATRDLTLEVLECQVRVGVTRGGFRMVSIPASQGFKGMVVDKSIKVEKIERIE